MINVGSTGVNVLNSIEQKPVIDAMNKLNKHREATSI